MIVVNSRGAVAQTKILQFSEWRNHLRVIASSTATKQSDAKHRDPSGQIATLPLVARNDISYDETSCNDLGNSPSRFDL